MLRVTLFNINTFFPIQTIMPRLIRLSLLVISSFFLISFAHAEKSYIKCWKNDEGLTECGNRIPRKYYNTRVRYIDEQGVTRKVKERAKTAEEIESEKELQRLVELETEQKRQSDEYDSVLLKTYLTIDDLLTSLNSKLAIIQSRSKVLQSSIELKKREFGNLVRKAADMERSGKQIPDKLATDLETSRKELRNMQSQINTDQENSKKIQQTFAHDVERFMISKSHRIKHGLSTPSVAKKLRAVKLTCISNIQCNSHWQKANEFIMEFATKKILYQTDKVTVTDIPVEHHDIAMGLSLLNDKESGDKKIMIFQIRCNRDREGQEFCSGEDVFNLLKEFKPYVYEK